MKEQAIELRNAGLSLNQICKRLGKSETTVYRWIREIPNCQYITDRRKKNLITGYAPSRIGTKNSGYDKYKKLRNNYYDLGMKLFNEDYEFRNLCLLYWCEGKKDRNKNVFGFTNTDHTMIAYVVKVLRKIGYLIRPRIYIVCHQDSATDTEITEFWQKIVPEAVKIKISRKPPYISKKKNRHKYGICSIFVHSTALSCIILSCVEYIQNNESALTTMCAT